MTTEQTYPDTADGAVRLLRTESDLPWGVRAPRVTPDPHVRGCWLVEEPERGWKAIAYVGPHPAAPDFEVADTNTSNGRAR